MTNEIFEALAAEAKSRVKAHGDWNTWDAVVAVARKARSAAVEFPEDCDRECSILITKGHRMFPLKHSPFCKHVGGSR
jgi:hypothetical protein